MDFSISGFLTDIAEKEILLPEIRKLIALEINKYTGMRLLLAGNENAKSSAGDMLRAIDKYLEDLEIAKLKFRYTFMALFKSTPEENPEINMLALKILKNLNSRRKV